MIRKSTGYFSITILVLLGTLLACDSGSGGNSVKPPTTTACRDFDGDAPAVQVPIPLELGGALRVCRAVTIRLVAGGRIERRTVGCFYDCPQRCVVAAGDELCVIGEDDER